MRRLPRTKPAAQALSEKRLADAEQGWQRGQPAPSERDDERGRQQRIPNPFKDRDDDDDRRYSEGSKKRRKKSFFDELFD